MVFLRFDSKKAGVAVGGKRPVRPLTAAAGSATSDSAADRMAKTSTARLSAASSSLHARLPRVGSRSRPEARGPAPSSRGAGAARDAAVSPPRARPARWLDCFCIIGVTPGADLDAAGGPTRAPVLLDCHPQEDGADAAFPAQLPDFCFPDGGCRPLRCQVRGRESDLFALCDQNKTPHFPFRTGH